MLILDNILEVELVITELCKWSPFPHSGYLALVSMVCAAAVVNENICESHHVLSST